MPDSLEDDFFFFFLVSVAEPELSEVLPVPIVPVPAVPEPEVPPDICPEVELGVLPSIPDAVPPWLAEPPVELPLMFPLLPPV